MPHDVMPRRASSGRPTVDNVRLSSTTWSSEATVSLADGEYRAVGESTGDRTPLGLKVVAEATVDAVTKLWGDPGVVLKGVSIAETVGEELVLVVVTEGDEQKIGAALVNEEPIPDATARATLVALDGRLVAGD
jgi:hypothetical protein